MVLWSFKEGRYDASGKARGVTECLLHCVYPQFRCYEQ